MRSDNRLSRVLHVLIHMDQHDGPMTSDQIATMLNANAAVMRRTMSRLKDRGYVQSEKGRGGGWILTSELAEISLLDVYDALGKPPVFALGFAEDSPSCLIEQAVNHGLQDALLASQKILFDTLSKITIAALAEDFKVRGKTFRPVATQH